MNPRDLLAELDRLDIPYRVVGADLQVKKGAVPPDLLAAIKQHKADIIAALVAPPRLDARKTLSAASALSAPPVPDPEVDRRVVAFRQQLREWRQTRPRDLSVPFFCLDDSHEFSGGVCASCGADRGEPLPPPTLHLRCPACRTAAEMVLAEEPVP